MLSPKAKQSLLELQNSLEAQNNILHKEDVTEFLISDQLRQKLSGYDPFIDEQVFVYEDEFSPSLAVYINTNSIEHLSSLASSQTAATSSYSQEFLVVSEGISHFLYLVEKAHHEKSVTLLELELQAEVDKYIYLFLKNKLQSNVTKQQELFKQVFENYTIHSHLDAEQKQRYYQANQIGAKFCYKLMRLLQSNKDLVQFRAILHQFFKNSLEAKMKMSSEL